MGAQTDLLPGDEQPRPPGSSRVRRSAHATTLSSHRYGYGGRRCLGFEWPNLGVVWGDDAVGGFGHLVPDAGDVAERFGDDQPRVV
jgi:hypothetical protein